MNVAMTIDEFHTLLASAPERDKNPLLEAVHKLTAIDEPKAIAALAEEAGPIWTSWRAV